MSRYARYFAIAAVSAAMLAGTPAVHADGVPGLRGHDHTGITVPDIKQAADFFINVLGCKEAMSFGPFADEKGTFMANLLNVNPRAVINQITLVRCGYGSNIELFQYSSPDQKCVRAKEQRHRRLSHRLLCRRHQSGEGLSRQQGREDLLRPFR